MNLWNNLLQLLEGAKGAFLSTKATVVVPVIIFACIARWTNHLDGPSFTQLLEVILPAWLGSHAYQTVNAPPPPSAPPAPPAM